MFAAAKNFNTDLKITDALKQIFIEFMLFGNLSRHGMLRSFTLTLTPA